MDEMESIADGINPECNGMSGMEWNQNRNNQME